MAFASLKGPVRDKIINSGFMEKANETLFFMGIQEAVDWYHTGSKERKNFTNTLKQKNNRKKIF